MEYRTEISELSGDALLIGIAEDGKEFWIPKDPANSDYQRYLNPEAEQSTLGLVNSDKPAEPVV